jgi:signal transduction histidine kinase/DNA-binding response OmpR family regulator
MPIQILSYLYRPYLLTVGSLMFLAINIYGISDKTNRKEFDSINILVQKCPTDTGRFAILHHYFWQLSNAGAVINQTRPIGKWAFGIIKNSKNQKACSDGYDIKGYIFEKENKLDSAINCYETALAISSKIGYKVRIAWSYYHLSHLYDAFGKHYEAINLMKLSTKTFESIHYLNNAYDGMEKIVLMYMRSCQYDSADAYIQKRLILNRKLNNKTNEIFTYNNYAWYYKKVGDSKKSINYMNCALHLAENNKGLLLSDVYVIIGEFFLGQKKNKQLAFNYCKKGFEADSSSTYVYQLFAKYYLEESNDSMALKYALLAVDKANDNKDLYEANQTLAAVYKHIGKTKLALSTLMKCYERAHSYYPEFEFYETLLEIADLNLELSNYGEALKYYNETLEMAERYHAYRAIVLASLKMGNCYAELNKLGLSERYLLSANNKAKEIRDIYLQKSTTEALRNLYALNNNIQAAYKYSLFLQTMRDSIAQIDNEASLAELEMKFELDKIKQDNDTRQAISFTEIKRQKTFRNAFILISGLLILLGFAVFSSYRRKRKDNKLLTSQKKEIEEKNFEIQSQIEEILTQKDEIERISQTLHETDLAKLRFFSNISHEIRTPLTLIVSPLNDFIGLFNGNQEQKKQLELIFNNATRLQELTNQILDLQKLDSGKLTLSFEKDNIIAHAKGIISAFEGFCNKTNCSLLFHSEYSSVFCVFDKDKISKILSNLLSNAFKYSEAGGCIKISIIVDAQKIKLKVIDNGIGIPSEQIDKVFDRYYQLEHSNIRFEGTGIGLAYVKELVELMKGNITIQCEENTGTTVEVVLPFDNIEIVDFSACEVQIKPDKQYIVNNSAIDLSDIDNENSPVVLIVEDNYDLRNYVGNIFKDNFQVLLAKNGKEGMDKATRYLPDAIISDVMMPIMDGIEMCSYLKKNEQTSHIPIIMLTAKDSYESQLDGYHSGADDYIVKPFDSDIIKLKLINILETREATRKKFSFGFDYEELKLLEVDNLFIQKCIKKIRENIDNPIFSTEQLAISMAFSQRNFYRKIKALTNQTPSDFIRIYKLQYAANLIKSNTMRMYEVASAIGFESPERFSQAFKKYYGVSPSEY